jgi:hypothetical protein
VDAKIDIIETLFLNAPVIVALPTGIDIEET